jgi:hypothetical protein
VLLEVILPIRKNDIDSAVELVFWRQEKNHKSYLSHRKKGMENAA